MPFILDKNDDDSIALLPLPVPREVLVQGLYVLLQHAHPFLVLRLHPTQTSVSTIAAGRAVCTRRVLKGKYLGKSTTLQRVSPRVSQERGLTYHDQR